MTALDGKVAVVTGAAGGMGRGYALRLAELGADIVIVDIDLDSGKNRGELTAESVEEEVRARGRKAVSVEADLATRAGARKAIEKAVETFGKIDILINNAGGAITPMERSTATKCPDEDIDKLIGANLLTTIYCCQEAAPHLTRPGASIVNIATVGAQRASGNGSLAVYGAAKAGVISYTQYLAAELGHEGIRANCIAPGIIATARVAAAAKERNLGTEEQAKSNPMRRHGKVEDMLGAMEFLVSDMSGYITGEVIAVAGGAGIVTY